MSGAINDSSTMSVAINDGGTMSGAINDGGTNVKEMAEHTTESSLLAKGQPVEPSVEEPSAEPKMKPAIVDASAQEATTEVSNKDSEEPQLEYREFSVTLQKGKKGFGFKIGKELRGMTSHDIT